MNDRAADRILFQLKTRGPQTIGDLGAHFSMTGEAARQHLAKLAEAGLVTPEDRRQGRGRPKRFWALTDAGHARFPDSHAQLTVDLLQSVRELFGEAGLDSLIEKREAENLALYRAETGRARTLKQKLDALVELRDREGYMAECVEMEERGFLLIENHCPVCAAATECQGLCRSELKLFRDVLGPDCVVERTDHILSGARRCAYRITLK
ncbi:transcriptional regulator [Nisaea acidiphila]|uniref:Transcriptional regulator n=1 Tax=Nisaea acidiphila TaxID=1862145 RepID=A0A9J7AR97_9PROT|nr:metalloregulator ArsR/SmtB family transcription factor [Nisaea acidiphila]UUX49767.1 transcriptional regulator [Nisaea acidiphila]